ncbi:hypothetical protein H5202_20020, partial [Shewanella sp. SG41-4]|uniref:DUF6602 domain-containing protein n=1 Tax=Shewanella sp. SG41-4 TaxID=2760976 RepID=UPI0015FF1118
SVRVASPSGHLSREMDIVLYDSDELITLMNRRDMYEVYPVENTYGVIQVKSNLTTQELKSGLENLKSYKKLNPNGFTILFAYSSDMNWDLIVKHLKKYANDNPTEYYPNFVFILNRGFFAFGTVEKASFINSEISTLTDVTVHGYPDRQQQNLYQFQLMLLELCRLGCTGTVKLQDYFSLPLVSGDSSYKFYQGSFAEIGNCSAHGDFPRKISSENVTKISEWCKKQEPINSVKATHIAWGLPEDKEAYVRQPGMVYIYNPDGLELPDILTFNQEFGEYTVPVAAFDSIIIGDMCIQLPYYYSVKEDLITRCSKCKE